MRVGLSLSTCTCIVHRYIYIYIVKSKRVAPPVCSMPSVARSGDNMRCLERHIGSGSSRAVGGWVRCLASHLRCERELGVTGITLLDVAVHQFQSVLTFLLASCPRENREIADWQSGDFTFLFLFLSSRVVSLEERTPYHLHW